MPVKKDVSAGRRLAAVKKAPKFRTKTPQRETWDYADGQYVKVSVPANGPAEIPPDVRPFEADRALRLGFAPDDIPIRRAFEALSTEEAPLDPGNPWHWRILTFYLADAYFNRKAGKQAWDDAKRRTLLARIDRLERRETNMQIARDLRRIYPTEYGYHDAKSLARVVLDTLRIYRAGHQESAQ